MAKIMLNGVDYSAPVGEIIPYSTATPKVAGIASAGSSKKVSREDHVHPEQQSVPGNAGTVSGFRVSTTGERGCIPVVNTNGVMEVGKYIDFHDTGTSNDKDYNVRITAEENGISITGTTTGTFYGTFAGDFEGTATAADKADVARYLGQNGDASEPMTFYWNGQAGQPTWLWGGENGTNMYVYNPANFSVNYANSAGNADSVDGVHFHPGDATGAPNGFGYVYGFAAGGEYNAYVFPTGQMSVNYANSAGVANSVAYVNVSGRPTFSLSGTTLYINF